MLVGPRHVHALILPVELLGTIVIVCSLDRIELPRTPAQVGRGLQTLAHSPARTFESCRIIGLSGNRCIFSLSVLLFHPALLTPRRSGFLASRTSRLAATACTTSGPRQKRMRTRAPNEAARRRTWGGPADSSKARALLTKFTVPRLPRLFSRLIARRETENSQGRNSRTSTLALGARGCTRRIAASRVNRYGHSRRGSGHLPRPSGTYQCEPS
jgi:hypothetical protein